MVMAAASDIFAKPRGRVLRYTERFSELTARPQDEYVPNRSINIVNVTSTRLLPELYRNGRSRRPDGQYYCNR